MIQDSARDTIVAAATAPGRGGVAIVRLSGEAVPQMLSGLLGGASAERVRAAPRHALRARFRDAAGEALDAGLALYFPAPHSYTGEHVLELHAHGGPVLIEQLIGRALELGARRARAGEFTERAYLQGRLDLTQAEAVASLIDAASAAAARASLRALEGEFSRQVLALAERIGELRAWIEAAIDFAEEEIDFLSDPQLVRRLTELEQALAALQKVSRQGRVLTEGLSIVIAGRPNAGKSTLLNRLAGHEAAIVAAEPGTTRDILRERIVLDGLPLTLLDTAGLRPAAPTDVVPDAPPGPRPSPSTSTVALNGAIDPVEREGIRRARAAMDRADRILFVIDGATDPEALAWREERDTLPADVPVTLVLNKCDLSDTDTDTDTDDDRARAALAPAPEPPPAPNEGNDLSAAPPRVRLSALTGAGMDALATHLKASAGLTQPDSGVVSARARHVEALARVAAHVAQARALLAGRRHGELVAEELRAAQQALGEIVGEESNEALLGRIFSTFCIGK